MGSKRLELCQKSIFAVPDHLTDQWATEFLRLYPAANIFVTTKKDFETCDRKKFCARIATGDYDAVIIGQSQFEHIPISPERQERLLRQQIEEIADGIMDTKIAGGNSFIIKSRLKDRESWYIIPGHHPAIVEKTVFDTVQASQLRFSQPNKKKLDYPPKGKAFCGCCGHALSRTMQKTSYYYF